MKKKDRCGLYVMYVAFEQGRVVGLGMVLGLAIHVNLKREG